MKRMFPTASMLVTCIKEREKKESLNYFVVATKAYQLKKKMQRKKGNNYLCACRVLVKTIFAEQIQLQFTVS